MASCAWLVHVDPLDGEVSFRAVDVRPEHPDAEPAGLGVGDGYLVGVAHRRAEDGGHVLGGVVRLQVGCLVGDLGVAGGMRVVDHEVISDEGVRALDREVIDFLLADVLQRGKPLPDDIGSGEPIYLGIVHSGGDPSERSYADPALGRVWA